MTIERLYAIDDEVRELADKLHRLLSVESGSAAECTLCIRTAVRRLGKFEQLELQEAEL